MWFFFFFCLLLSSVNCNWNNNNRVFKDHKWEDKNTQYDKSFVKYTRPSKFRKIHLWHKGGTKCKIISKGRVQFSSMICGDPFKKKQIHIFKGLLASNCIYLMNKKPAIFISMLDVNSTFFAWDIILPESCSTAHRHLCCPWDSESKWSGRHSEWLAIENRTWKRETFRKTRVQWLSFVSKRQGGRKGFIFRYRKDKPYG